MEKNTTVPNLIDQIENLLELKGLTDSQFSNELGIHISVWSKIKNGHRSPSIKFLKTLGEKYPELRLAIYHYMTN